MRVVATEDFKTYYKMVCIDVAAGEGFDGEFADFLVTGGAPVEPASADKSPEPAAPQPPEDPPADPEVDSDPEPDGEPGDKLDITGTAADVLEWVGDDPQRAAEARAAEATKDKPRSTLLAKLDTITGP